MKFAAQVAQDLTAAGFVALGAAMAYRWYHDRVRGQGMLALALGSLAVVAALGRLQTVVPLGWPLSILVIVAFMLVSYFVLMFRHEFIPLGPNAYRAANVALAASIVASVVDVIFFQNGPGIVSSLFALLIVAVWVVFTGEPIIRFWLASNGLPSVQKARLRFFSFGFAVLIAIVVIDVVGGTTLQSPTAIFLTQLVALVSVPAIYVSFAPPTLLRRIWRMGEESAIRSAMQDLLIFSPTRHEIAERATFWAVRMVGAVGAFVADADGTIMATSGIETERAAVLLSSPESDPANPRRSVFKVPLHLNEGAGTLAVVSGPFTPVFGSEEILQLRAYASSVSAGLDRVRVTERMAALEENKSQFLNLASHELRGPVTVLRGYVSMLQGGMLGKLTERGEKAASVMATKVSEMNELIEEMIDAARLEEGGLTLRMVEADLREIAHSAVDGITPTIDSAHRVELDLPDRRVRVKVDPDRTRTIITNLLSNAIKYSPRGGVVECRVFARGGIARVAITDHGLGIADDQIPNLFRRFGRIITPETEHLKGTGLGLFLARQLARLQEGDITVISTPGDGSTFTLQLPSAGGVNHASGEHHKASADGEASHRAAADPRLPAAQS